MRSSPQATCLLSDRFKPTPADGIHALYPTARGSPEAQAAMGTLAALWDRRGGLRSIGADSNFQMTRSDQGLLFPAGLCQNWKEKKQNCLGPSLQGCQGLLRGERGGESPYMSGCGLASYGHRADPVTRSHLSGACSLGLAL